MYKSKAYFLFNAIKLRGSDDWFINLCQLQLKINVEWIYNILMHFNYTSYQFYTLHLNIYLSNTSITNLCHWQSKTNFQIWVAKAIFYSSGNHFVRVHCLCITYSLAFCWVYKAINLVWGVTRVIRYFC